MIHSMTFTPPSAGSLTFIAQFAGIGTSQLPGPSSGPYISLRLYQGSTELLASVDRSFQTGGSVITAALVGVGNVLANVSTTVELRVKASSTSGAITTAQISAIELIAELTKR